MSAERTQPSRRPPAAPSREGTPAPPRAVKQPTTRVPARLPRLPGPIREGRARKEVVLREGVPADGAGCAALDGAYATTHVWQLDSRREGDDVRVSFRLVRLPRELELTTAHRPPRLRGATLPRGLCWLVAEEVEVLPDGSRAPAAADAPAGWTHMVRRTGSVSTVQLGLPEEQAAREGANSATAGYPGAARIAEAPYAGIQSGASGRILGYLAMAQAPGDHNAYLQSLIVDRAHRRKGIAIRLLVAAQRWARGQGATELMADVAARNYPAARLLQKAGFEFCGFNDRCYPDHEVAVFWSCRLR